MDMSLSKTPGVGDEQGGLACCDSWGHKESDTTEWLNWTELRVININHVTTEFLNVSMKLQLCNYMMALSHTHALTDRIYPQTHLWCPGDQILWHFWYLVLSGMTHLRGETQEPPNLQNKREEIVAGSLQTAVTSTLLVWNHDGRACGLQFCSCQRI